MYIGTFILIPLFIRSYRIRHFQYYMLETHHMISVFAAMLHERRILFLSKSLKKLTSCIFAAESLIYPMYWQVNTLYGSFS